MAPSDVLRSARLTLTPLAVSDATEMWGVLADPGLYTFTGGEPPTREQLEDLYRHQVAGSARPAETWLNWVIRQDGTPIGYVQATVRGADADLGWVIGVPWQGRGFATEAVSAMRTFLVELGVARFSAHIHPDHVASQHVAVHLGLRPSDRYDEDGEMVWVGGEVSP
ncbi:MAG: GNAT family N-acetyltransferase [Acidimicrobiia bacterium]